MSQEVENAIRPDDETTEAPQGELEANSDTQVDETASVEAQPEPEPDGDGTPGTHPLEPGGKRFNQVYARAKEAELKLAAERERAARLEGELEARRQATTQPQQPAEKRYTGAQLQQMVDEGRATIGQVLDYQAETLRLESERRAAEVVEHKLATYGKQSKVENQLNEYRALVPDVYQVGTANHTKAMAEFTRLVNDLGYDRQDPRTEILAYRQAFGDPKTIRERQASKAIQPGRDTMQDTTTTSTRTPVKKDPIKDLPAAQKQHYQRMIDRGVYKGWKEVREELDYVPPR